jgi:spore coat protein U domain-containing protein, fimbrial subunit CupE1/2/3/6
MLTTTASGARAAGLFLIVPAALIATPAFAAITSSTLTVDATVTANCTVSTTGIDFGDVNPISGSNYDSTGAIHVTCTSGTGWTATAGIGSGSGASFASRRMTAGSDLLSYNLYTNAGRTIVWGDDSGTTDPLTGTGNGSAQNVTVYGRVGSGQTTLPPGDYSDTVSVTVTY